MTTGYLGLGGNLGDPAATMAEALRRLDASDEVEVVAASRLFRTPPWGKIDQPAFVNACAEIRTALDAGALLEACLDIERGLKRQRGERWGPRTIDIDVLTLGDAAFRSDRLTLPHPRLTERAFVLAPLCDLAPSLVIGGRSAQEWLARSVRDGIVPLGADRNWWRAAGRQLPSEV